ncbi:MAG: DUF2950 domain-containing protein [Hyphomicrobiaceae bacterium]
MRRKTAAKTNSFSTFAPSLAVIAALVAMFWATQGQAKAAPSDQTTFRSASAAIEALIAAAKAGNTEQVLQILGADAEEVVRSGDPVADESARARFVKAYEEAHALKAQDDGSEVLHIGSEDYPFPIPLVEEKGVWKFDTAAGLDEILTRRIGENELAAIEVLKAYVAAQEEYAARDRDGSGPQYARRITSTQGNRDGLYWDNVDGQGESPLGVLLAGAAAEGYGGGNAADETTRPYHGYFYKLLLCQGPSAEGGARDYLLNDRMIGGFAMVAAPAKYGNSGIMTFIVNQDGKVFEKDLGEETPRLASEMSSFDPDSSWRRSQSE